MRARTSRMRAHPKRASSAESVPARAARIARSGASPGARAVARLLRGVPESMSSAAPTVPARALQAAIADLQTVRPLPGAAQVSLRAAVVAIFAPVALRAWWAGDLAVFALAAVPVAFGWASLLILTHDAVHHTLTGVKHVDDALGRLISWPVLWCHATFFHVHALHHRMNGVDLADPERVHTTDAEIAAATGLARVRLRHKIVWDMVIRGAAGLIFETLGSAWAHRAGRPRIVGAMAQDLVCAPLAFGVVHALAWYVGEGLEPGRGLDAALGTFLLWVAIERVTGWVMYLRKYVEHDGVWEQGSHFFETQCFSTRNIRTNRFMQAFFSGLAHHSVHHAFPRIPAYAMEEAHRRVAALYEQVGRPLPESDGYVGAFRELWRRSRARVSTRA